MIGSPFGNDCSFGAGHQEVESKGTIALERMMGMVLIMISVQMFMNGLAGYGVK